MPKSNLRRLAAALIAASLGTILYPAALSAATAGEPSRTITVQGHGEAMGTPDNATITAGVTTEAKTAADALSANADAMSRVFAALKKIGVADKHIQTSEFSVQPQYAPFNANAAEPQRITGYQVSNAVTVMIDNVSNVGPAIDALVLAGVNQMNSISFGIKDEKALLAQARAAAVDDATAHAEVLTKAAHVTLGPILSIEEAQVELARPVFAMARAEVAPAPTRLAGGEQTLSASVSITWQIK